LDTYPESRSYREPVASSAAALPDAIPTALRQTWYFADRNQGTKTGPFPAEEIKREWNRGVMDPTWLAWHSGMETWQELRALPTLFCYLTGAPALNGGR